MEQKARSKQNAASGSLRRYIIGFGLSLALTLTAFYMVINHTLNPQSLVAAILLLAAIQLYVQLRFFLHLGQEPRPRWNLVVFLFMLVVLGIIVLGSLWIMQNLSYHMAPPDTLDQQIMNDEGIYR